MAEGARLMVIDSSALLAILLNEPERSAYTSAIAADPTRLMSAASYLATAIVLDRRVGRERGRDLKLFVVEADIEIVPVTLAHAETARAAYHRFGRGSHAGRLNFGDCLAYAAAKMAGEPLLYKGDDFRRTDIAAAV